MTVTQVPGSFGYLFAKTDSSGSRRYYSLYSRSEQSSSSGRIVFYYTGLVAGSLSPGRKVFNVDIADGQPHKLKFIVVQGLPVLQVDGVNYVPTDTTPLIAPQVEDCGSPSRECVFRIGDRSAPLGSAYPFDGTMHFASMCPNSAEVGQYPLAGSPTVQHLLRQSINPNQTIHSISPFARLSPSGFSIFFEAAIVGSGYLFAKTNNDGSLRHMSVYVIRNSAGDSVRLYYKPQGSTTHASVTFRPVNLADGVRRRIMITVQDARVTLHIDQFTAQANLAGQVDDCTVGSGSGDCVLYLGRRAAPAGQLGFPIAGAIYRALVEHNAALSAYP